MSVKVSIIVPVLNEASTLPTLIAHLSSFQTQEVEVLIVDGASEDASPDLIRESGLRHIASKAGRAEQMNVGAQSAAGHVLLFLHADTRLPSTDLSRLPDLLARHKKVWGRFDIKVVSQSLGLPLVATLINLRSRLTGIATGDQCLFMTRQAFEAIGGFPDQPLMEDVEISKRLKPLSSPLSLHCRATTSGRRWDKQGFWRTIFLMWRLRWAYWRGADPAALHRHYYSQYRAK